MITKSLKNKEPAFWVAVFECYYTLNARRIQKCGPKHHYAPRGWEAQDFEANKNFILGMRTV